MGAAELGLRIGLGQLAAAPAPLPDTDVLHPGPTPTDSVQVMLRPGARHVPPGFSAGTLIAQDYEIHSTGRSARGTRRTLVQGVTRLETPTQVSP